MVWCELRQRSCAAVLAIGAVSALISHPVISCKGVQFTCKAHIARIEEQKGWFYIACSECRKKLQPRGTTLACSDHQPTVPKYLYLLTSYIRDDTTEVKSLFFDNAVNSMIHTQCKTMVEQHGYTDPEMLPAPLTSLVGATKIFQMRYNKSSKPGAIDFVTDRVFDDVTPDAETNISSKRSSQDDVDDRNVKRSTHHGKE